MVAAICQPLVVAQYPSIIYRMRSGACSTLVELLAAMTCVAFILPIDPLGLESPGMRLQLEIERFEYCLLRSAEGRVHNGKSLGGWDPY
jgi:hypothetical protein